MVEKDTNKNDSKSDDGGSKPDEGTQQSDSKSSDSGENNEPEKGLIDEIREEKKELAKVRDSIKKENDRTEKLQVNAELAGKGYANIPTTFSKFFCVLSILSAMFFNSVVSSVLAS